ncbi:MAG: metallophosphoesterase family protein [Deltaproteobacteria bacterium]|nr:metallophosphoesterase family protein [Deltaproteobacteria bacterium]
MKSVFCLALVGALVVLSPLASAATLTKGPYLQDLRVDGVTVVWETDTDSAGVLEYGPTEALGSASASGPSGTHHEVRLAGLDAATLYHYRINVDGQPAGQAGTFVTAPDKKAPFTFLAFGDNRSDPNAHALIVSRMLQHQPAFIINTGDMVSDGKVEDQWTDFFKIEAEQVRDTVMWPTVGNHEEDNHKVPAPYLRLMVPPESAKDHPSYYSFDYSNSHFIVLDHHAEMEAGVDCIFRIQAFDECFSADQLAWLKADLAAANQNDGVDNVFVIAHMGPYSSKKGRSGSAQLRALLPLFASSKVSMIISGHDHYYEHGHTSNGLNYVITGGGGAPLYETQGTVGATPYPHKIMVSTSVYNFISVYVAGQQVDVTAYQANGDEIESFGFGPAPDCIQPDDCAAYEEGACEGAWACNDNMKCQWVCDAPQSCITAGECGDPPGDRCKGAWECVDNACQWVCDATPDCVSDSDCEGRAGLTGCDGGYFACMDGMCEWTCPQRPPEDTGTAHPTDEAQVPDAAQPTDPGVVQDPGGGSVNGGSCSLGASASPLGTLLLLLAAAFWFLKKRSWS